jgi:hypothetical protein
VPVVSSSSHELPSAAFRRYRFSVMIAVAIAVLGTACGTHEALIGAEDVSYGGTPGGAGSRSDSGNSGTGTAGGRQSASGDDSGPASAGAASGSAAAGNETAGNGSVDPTGAIKRTVGVLDGRLMQFPCAADSAYDDCDALGYAVDGVVHACVDGKSEMVLDHPIAGAPGARFRLDLHFYGIMEPKSYGPSAVREAAPGSPDRDGGLPTSWATAPAGVAVAINSFDSYELRVHDPAGVETARYYLNASPDEGHWTLLIDYEKSIEVEAGGLVRLRRYDSNCRLIKNCGAGLPPCAAKAREVDLSAADPPPRAGPFPSGFNPPGMNKDAGSAGQWWLVDVTAVTAL